MCNLYIVTYQGFEPDTILALRYLKSGIRYLYVLHLLYKIVLMKSEAIFGP